MSNLTPRERVRLALSHQEADRVPIDLGGWQSGISYETYEALKQLLRIDAETRIEERVQGLAWVDEPVLEMFNVDTRYIFPGTKAGGKWSLKGEDSFIDAWGIEWKRLENSHYYDIVHSPLKSKSIDDIDKLDWPRADTFISTEGIKERLRSLVESSYAIFTCIAGVFEQATYVRGMTELYMDIVMDPRLFEAVLDRVLEAELNIYKKYFSIVGDQLDVVQFWGDLGSQRAPLISPEHYRKYIKPREAELVRLTKEMTNAKVCLHSCGSTYVFIPDLIDAGYDMLNPVQTTAKDMDPIRLKKEFGNDLVFWGAIDTQKVLPFGTEQEVRDEVKRQIDALAPGGGYLLAPCHNIQADTPPENVMAMFEAAEEHGAYL